MRRTGKNSHNFSPKNMLSTELEMIKAFDSFVADGWAEHAHKRLLVINKDNTSHCKKVEKSGA